MSNSAKSTDKTPESGVLSYKTADAAPPAPQAAPQKSGDTRGWAS